MANIVVKTIKKVVKEDVRDYLEGEVSKCGTQGCVLSNERGGVYGFAIKLTEEEKKDVFNEFNGKKYAKTVEEWKTIGDDFYPLYWGKDINLGFRLREHTISNKSVRSIQLNEKVFLRGKEVLYGAVICAKREDNEKKMREQYPDILKTVPLPSKD